MAKELAAWKKLTVVDWCEETIAVEYRKIWYYSSSPINSNIS
jgi:hypothetical protein